MASARKGKFKVTHKEKYKGDPTNVIYRSMLERAYMKYFDENVNVLEWSSEETVIPYISKVDGKSHRYFPDFKVKVKNRAGELVDYLIEIKPFSQTFEPKPPADKRGNRRYFKELTTWHTNCSKWEAATAWCAKNGHVFKVWTEKTIGMTYKPKKRRRAPVVAKHPSS
jgi:hypothetical protein